MSAQWPLVAARLVALLPTLDGWDSVTVYDGPATGGSPQAYTTVGFVPGTDSGGSYTTALWADGFQTAENGTVIGQLVCETGGRDIPGMRAQAFALMDALDAAVRADRRLGVLSAEGTSSLTVDPMPGWKKQGTAYGLNWTLSYFTVT